MFSPATSASFIDPKIISMVASACFCVTPFFRHQDVDQIGLEHLRSPSLAPMSQNHCAFGSSASPERVNPARNLRFFDRGPGGPTSQPARAQEIPLSFSTVASSADEKRRPPVEVARARGTVSVDQLGRASDGGRDVGQGERVEASRAGCEAALLDAQEAGLGDEHLDDLGHPLLGQPQLAAPAPARSAPCQTLAKARATSSAMRDGDELLAARVLEEILETRRADRRAPPRTPAARRRARCTSRRRSTSGRAARCRASRRPCWR